MCVVLARPRGAGSYHFSWLAHTIDDMEKSTKRWYTILRFRYHRMFALVSHSVDTLLSRSIKMDLQLDTKAIQRIEHISVPVK